MNIIRFVFNTTLPRCFLFLYTKYIYYVYIGLKSNFKKSEFQRYKISRFSKIQNMWHLQTNDARAFLGTNFVFWATFSIILSGLEVIFL